MSRARNIKPAFFKNEVLVGLPFEYRLLFIGLWTLADREGRFEDRPIRIKMELFPADPVDVDAGLSCLRDGGFIERYVIDGVGYCQIVSWSKHQNPHCKESASTIPAPCKHGAGEVPAPKEHGTSRADSLIPDSLIPDSKARSVGETPTSVESTPPVQSPASRACQLMIEAGLPRHRVNHAHPKLIEAIEAGVTAEEFAAAVPQALGSKATNPFVWAIAVAIGNRTRGTGPSARGSPLGESRTLAGMKSLDDVQLNSDGKPTYRRRTDERDQDGPAQAALPGA